MVALVDWNDPAAWSFWYGARNPATGQTIGYSRDWATLWGAEAIDEGGLKSRADHLLAAFPDMATTDRILIVGCGYGFLIEVLRGRGFTLTFGLDSSSHIESNRGTESDGTIVLVSDDIRGGGRVKAALRQATGDDEFDWVITESVLESYTDDDVLTITGLCPAVLYNVHGDDHIIHIVFQPPFDPPGVFNEKTLRQWYDLRPEQSWIDAEGGTMLGPRNRPLDASLTASATLTATGTVPA